MTTRLSPLRRSTLRIGIVGLTAAVALSACGSDDSGGPSSSDSTDITTIQLEDTMDAGDLSSLITDAMEAKVSGVMTMEGSGIGAASGNTEFTFTDGKMAAKSSMDVAGQQFETITTADGATYISGIPMAAMKWVKIDPDADDPMSQAMSSMSQNFGSPDAFAEKLTGIEAKRTANNDGESTYEYKVDAAKITEGANAPAAEITLTWVVTEDGLPVSSSVTGVGDTEMTTTYSDWGKEVTIEAPSDDEVGEMPNLEMPTPSAS